MTKPTAAASTLWIMLLTLASTIGTLALACATPFTALAALTATQMRRRDALMLMIGTWGASQAVGFGILDYPTDARTLAWGGAIGLAAVAAALAARPAAALAPGGTAGRLATGYVAAAIAYQAVIAIAALGLGGIAISLSPSLFAEQFVRNAAILVALYALYRGLTAIGVPALTSARPVTLIVRLPHRRA